MRLVTYDRGGEKRAGIVVGEAVVDLERAGARLGQGPKLPASVRGLLEAGPAAMKRAAALQRKAEKMIGQIEKGRARRPAWLHPLAEVHLNAPVPDPEKVICLGLNYLDHIRESISKTGREAEVPKDPIIFAKFPSTLTGPFDPIRLPPRKIEKQVDYEVEMAFVIGRTAYRVARREAMDYVAGYMVLHDVSGRECQFNDKQFVRGKSFDTFAPCGPWLVTPDEIPNPHRLRLTATVNGQVLQDGSTRDLIFKIPQIISILSQGMTLRPGDIISTGTPCGVGFVREPPILLGPGDAVECWVESIGTIRNVCIRS